MHKMHKKLLIVLLAAVMLTGALSACGRGGEQNAEPVTLTVAGGWTDCRALDVAAAAFTKKYPNVTINYEYLQDYYASVEKRMSGENPVDLFFSVNIQADNSLLNYALDLNSRDDIDLSDTFPGLIDNFTFREEAASGEKKLYAVPLGAEMRGMYVNKTLLAKVGKTVPTNSQQLLTCCEALVQAGYIPLHGNPGSFPQLLMYPWVANEIANAKDDSVYQMVASRSAGVSQCFAEPMAFLYNLVEKNYYDYKTAQTELNLFNDTTDEDYVRYFLNIKEQDGVFVKADDIGQIAFMPAIMSLQSLMDKTKEDYHSEIEYEFIPSPIGSEGGYAYLSPAHGIAVNKNSAKVDWAAKFIDFLFEEKNNKTFCEVFHAIPNTKNAFSYISSLYDLPKDHISELGQVTFDYDFYDIIKDVMVDVSKANNPKYMQEDGTLYPYSHYMEELEKALSQQ